jgi:hypothetical protein
MKRFQKDREAMQIYVWLVVVVRLSTDESEGFSPVVVVALFSEFILNLKTKRKRNEKEGKNDDRHREKTTRMNGNLANKRR